VNLFMNSRVDVKTKNGIISLSQSSNYPWDGDIRIKIENKKAVSGNLMIRVPGWIRGEVVPGDLFTFVDGKKAKPVIKLNGKTVKIKLNRGYVRIARNWKKGDVVDLKFPMEVKKVTAHKKVKAKKGLASYQYGPVVYCAEGIDNQGHAVKLAISDKNPMHAEFKTKLLNGVNVLKGRGTVVDEAGDKKIDVTLVPYYAWNNRGLHEMNVWFLDN